MSMPVGTLPDSARARLAAVFLVALAQVGCSVSMNSDEQWQEDHSASSRVIALPIQPTLVTKALAPVSIPIEVASIVPTASAPAKAPLKMEFELEAVADGRVPVLVSVAVSNATPQARVPVALDLAVNPSNGISVPAVVNLSSAASPLPVNLALGVQVGVEPKAIELPVTLRVVAWEPAPVTLPIRVLAAALETPAGSQTPPPEGSIDFRQLGLLLLIILIAGAAGGYLRSDRTGMFPREGAGSGRVRDYQILWGILAASLLPAVLQLAGSAIMDKVDQSAAYVVVLWGLCLSAAVFGAEFCEWALRLFSSTVARGELAAPLPPVSLYDIDLTTLAEELRRLCDAKAGADAPAAASATATATATDDHERAKRSAELRALRNAETAARELQHDRVIEHLRKAGPWALEQSRRLELRTATEALERVLGPRANTQKKTPAS